MTRHTRRIFFYCCIAIFLVLAPLLIAYSLGYIIHPNTRSLEKTGGVFIKSRTPRMSVFLDGTFMKETSYLSGDALLTEIAPGVHRLRLEKAGHYPWSKTISVEPTLVADFRNILLVSNPVAIATSTPSELASLRASATTGSFQVVAPKETIALPDAYASPSLPVFFLDTNRNLVAKTATTTKHLVSHINSFGIVQQTVYFIDKNGFLGKVDPISKDITTIGRPGFYLADKPAQFSSAPDGTLVILDASGGLFLSDGSTNIQTITGGVRQFAFDLNGKKMLLRKDQIVDILWLQDNTFQPFEKSGTREEIFSGDALVQDADWLFADNAHIVVRTVDGIFLVDTDARDHAQRVELFSKKTDEVVTIPPLPSSVFFRKGKIFYTISIER